LLAPLSAAIRAVVAAVEARAPDEGLPPGWPRDWPTPSTIDHHRIDPPAYTWLHETPAEATRRVERERGKRALDNELEEIAAVLASGAPARWTAPAASEILPIDCASLTAAGQRLGKSTTPTTREIGEAALATLVAACPPPPMRPAARPALVASGAPYRGGLGRLRVQFESGRGRPIVTDARGRWLPGLTVDEQGMPVLRGEVPELVAAATPTPRGIERAHAIAQLVNRGVEGMVEIFKDDDAASETSAQVARLASAVERLAARPVNVTVKAPDVTVKPPDVHVPAPVVKPPDVHVTVEAPKPPPARAVRVEYDDDGNKWFIPETEC
jgi:hypothetical protein